MTETNKVFFIIGAQKGASTHLYEYLRNSPLVYGPKYEFSFFDSLLYDEQIVKLRLRDSFEKIDNERQFLGFKRPTLLGDLNSLKLVHRHLPYARILIVLRERVTRSESAYWWYLKDSLIPKQRINDVFLHLLNNGSFTGYPRSSELLTHSIYSPGIKLAIDLFGENEVMITVPDREGKWLQKVSNYLEIPASVETSRVSNIGIKGFYRCLFWSRTNNWVLNYDNNHYLNWKNYTGSNLVRGFRRVLLSLIPEFINFDKDTLNASVNSSLSDYFYEDNFKLNNLYLNHPKAFAFDPKSIYHRKNELY